MQTLTEVLMQTSSVGRVVSQKQLARLLDGTAQRRHNLVNRALGHGELLQLRRGLYVLPALPKSRTPHPFVLAQALQPGSYISFETALSFHGWIPESVNVTLSVAAGRRRLEVDRGALGLFRFFPLALRRGRFLEAVDRLSLDGQAALVAQPLRALTDIICLRRLEAGSLAALTQSMRIDPERLAQTRPAVWQVLERVYARKRMAVALQALKGETAP